MTSLSLDTIGSTTRSRGSHQHDLPHQSAIRQELTSSLNERLEKRFRDEWIDSQHDLNVIVGLITKRDPLYRHVKVIQTFHGALDIGSFLDALVGSKVTTLAFVGISMDQEYCYKLAKAISDSNTSMSCLQLCRIVPAGLIQICPAVSNSKNLKELRLTFNHDLSQERVALLMKSLGKSQTLEIFKLYCVDLQWEGTKLLANAIQTATRLTDLRITSCNLNNIEPLSQAINNVNRLRKIDLSMNQISNIDSISSLWECPSITYLSLSQNELGMQQETIVYDNNEEGEIAIKRKFDCLATNKTLKKLYFDMNPLSPMFVKYLTRALQKNTTLLRLGLLTLTVPNEAARRIRYLISLNCAGRGSIQAGFPDRRLFPYLLSRVSKEPDIIYGLITQDPKILMVDSNQKKVIDETM